MPFQDSCLRSNPHGYSSMVVWALARGTYMARQAKESSFKSLIMRLIHHLVASTICHRVESDQVPNGDLFYTWCFICSKVYLNIPSLFLFIYLDFLWVPYLRARSVEAILLAV